MTLPTEPPSGLRRLALVLAVALPLGCDASPGPTEPALPLRQTSEQPAELLHCPNAEERSASALVTPLGGVFELLDHVIVIPQGAVASLGTLRVTEPVSPWMEISVRIGEHERYEFLLPVVMRISYSRCQVPVFGRPPFRVLHIDETTKEPLEDMGGIDERLTRSVVVTTDHLSGYAVAQ